eukprot:jgi/Chrzof1/9252/UNPLg00219.t1
MSIPGSQQEAIEEAVQALRVPLQQLLSGSKAKSKGFGSSKRLGNRFSIELPVADDNTSQAVQLVQSIVKLLPNQASGCTLVYADKSAAAAGQKVHARCHHLQDACRLESLTGPLLLVGPSVADVALVEQLVDEVWSGPFVLLLNPTWQTAAIPAQYTEVADSFLVVYSFLPISIKGLVGNKEGAVLRVIKSNSELNSAYWNVLWMDKPGRFVRVARTKHRPQQSDLELAFMNASASASPLTSAVKGFKSLLDRKQ